MLGEEIVEHLFHVILYDRTIFSRAVFCYYVKTFLYLLHKMPIDLNFIMAMK